VRLDGRRIDRIRFTPIATDEAAAPVDALITDESNTEVNDRG